MKQKWLKWVLVAGLPIILLFLSYYLFAFSETYYVYQFEKQGVIADKDMGLQVLEFLEGEGGLDAEFWEPGERSHLNDVRELMHKVSLFGVALILLWLFGVFQCGRKLEILQLGGYAGLILFGLSLLSLLVFDWMFVLFHYVFFEPGTWMFAGGALIRIFLHSFFFETARNIFLVFGVVSLVMVLVGKYCVRFQKS